MSWLENYNGEGARWWHIIVLFLFWGGFFTYILFFGGEPEVVTSEY
jgi:hypothetical protein